MNVCKPILPLVLCFLLLAGLLSCGDAVDQTSRTTITNEVLEAPAISPVSPTNPVKGMPFADEASRYFSNYFAHYRQYFPEMTFGDFLVTDTLDNFSYYVYEETVDLYNWVSVFGDYAFRSPNQQYWLDVVSYGVEQTPTGTWIAEGPDSEVALIEAMSGKRTRLLFCGSACSFAEGFWMNDKTIVVAGLSSDEAGFKPSIWHIDLADRRIITYVYPWALREGQLAYSALVK